MRNYIINIIPTSNTLILGLEPWLIDMIVLVIVKVYFSLQIN